MPRLLIFVLVLALFALAAIPDADARRRRSRPAPPPPPDYAQVVLVANEYVANGGIVLHGTIAGCSYRDIPVVYWEFDAIQFLRVFDQPCLNWPQAYLRPRGMGHIEPQTPEEAEGMLRTLIERANAAEG